MAAEVKKIPPPKQESRFWAPKTAKPKGRKGTDLTNVKLGREWKK